MMWPINRVLGAVFGFLVMPFRGMPSIVGLTVISLLVSIGILIAFGSVSDQDALVEVRRHIHAGVFEIRLFNDDLRTILSAQLDILRHTMRYFRLSMVPMLWLMLPIAIVVIQLQFQYGYEVLEPGESTLLQVKLTDEQAALVSEADGTGLAVETGEGVGVETPAVWIPSLREAGWRIRAETPGEHEVVVRVGDGRLTKSVRVGGTTVLRSPVRPSGLLGQIIFPGEEPVPSGSGVEEVRVGYADAAVNLFGWETHWIIAFFILTMAFAFGLQRPLGVKI